MKIIEVKRGNVMVKVYEWHRVPAWKGVIIADLSSGRRKLRTVADRWVR